MSVERPPALSALIWLGLIVPGVAAADEETPPDLELLEYLGSWEGSDEEWMLFSEETEIANSESSQRSDPEQEGEESTESENES